MTGFRVYTEDTGEHGIEVVRTVVSRTLRLLGHDLPVHPPLDRDH